MRTRKTGGKRKKEERKGDGEEGSERSEDAQRREEGEKHPVTHCQTHHSPFRKQVCRKPRQVLQGYG